MITIKTAICATTNIPYIHYHFDGLWTLEELEESYPVANEAITGLIDQGYPAVNVILVLNHAYRLLSIPKMLDTISAYLTSPIQEHINLTYICAVQSQAIREFIRTLIRTGTRNADLIPMFEFFDTSEEALEHMRNQGFAKQV